MTFGAILFFVVVLPVCLFLKWLLNRKHRQLTGLDIPSRGAWRSARRRGRKKGLSDEQTYDSWIARKQRRR